MKEYRRFVAYVYEYQKGKKGRNCGFIQVEAKEQNCRMEVHLLCPGLLPDVNCEIFGFVRNGGLMDGILIGECRTGGNRADCVLETDRDSLGGSEISLEKIGGMILLTESGGFFGTEWDDRTIRPDHFRRIKLPEEQQRPEQQQETVNQREEPLLPETSEKQEESSTPETSEKQEVLSIPEIPETQEESSTPEIPEKKEEELLVSEVSEQKEEVSPEAVEKQEKKKTDMVSQALPETSQQNKEWFWSIGEPAVVFEDEEIFDCRKIQLRDLCRLRLRECGLRNNRFLQHGFYNFGHLIIGKKRSGEYVLGVPGVYDQQEQFMANMFGFPYFRESRQIRLPKGRGGYWYRLINTSKFY